jgi:hypothetical protein
MTLLSVWRAFSRRSGLDFGWVLLWVAGLVMLWDPDLTRVAARAVGIQRGVDLVLYLAVIGGVIGFFAVSIRFRRVERQLTTLVRELSMLTPREPGPRPTLGASGQEHGQDGEQEKAAFKASSS